MFHTRGFNTLKRGARIACLPLLMSWSASSGAALLAHWSGDGNANDSTGTYNGTLLNGATFGAGVHGQAFSLSGTGTGVTGSSVLVSPPVPNVSTGLTMTAWINPASLATENQIFNNENSYEWAVRSGTLQYAIQDTGGAGNWFWVNTGIGVALNTWQFFALTYDAGSNTVRVYDQSGSQLFSNSTLIQGNVINAGGYNRATIGARSLATDAYGFDGLIDEVWLFDHALDAQEIATIARDNSYGSGQVPVPSALYLFAAGLLLLRRRVV